MTTPLLMSTVHIEADILHTLYIDPEKKGAIIAHIEREMRKIISQISYAPSSISVEITNPSPEKVLYPLTGLPVQNPTLCKCRVCNRCTS